MPIHTKIVTDPTKMEKLILPPGIFRLSLAYIVFVNHTLPIHLGSVAVYIFFMLSGFWVHQMWFKEYALIQSAYTTFIISRFWRLLPIYYVSLSILILSINVFPSYEFLLPEASSWTGLHFYLSHLLILGNAPLPDHYKIFLPIWSLDIEIQFYVTFPIIIYLLKENKFWFIGQLILWVVSGFGVLCFIVFYGGIHAQSAFLPMYITFFLLGVVTARSGWFPHPRLAVGGWLLGLSVRWHF